MGTLEAEQMRWLLAISSASDLEGGVAVTNRSGGQTL